MSANDYKYHNQFRTALADVSDVLNEQDIAWVLGASGSLYVHGIDVQPRDIDLVIDPVQFDLAVKLLEKYAPSPPQEGMFNGIVYRNTGFKNAAFPTEASSFIVDTDNVESVVWEGILVNVNPLEFELEMYKARPDKKEIVEKIQEALDNKG